MLHYYVRTGSRNMEKGSGVLFPRLQRNCVPDACWAIRVVQKILGVLK